MSTHNICFRGEIRKIFTKYPPLSKPMALLESAEGENDHRNYFTSNLHGSYVAELEC